MSDGPYSRVYWSIVDDPEFEGIFDDDAALALWLRLLLIADGAWPSSANLPRSAKARPLKALTDAGLVRLRPSGRFTIRGMDAERGKRQQSARNAAALRWQSNGTANRNAETMPSREETRKDEPSIARAGARGTAVMDRQLRRRLEWHASGGAWDPEWGPEPNR